MGVSFDFMASESFEASPLVSDKSSEAEYGVDGVDLTLVRWMLSLTSAEPLQVLQENVRSIDKLRSRFANP